MRMDTLDIDLDRLALSPKECLAAVYWELQGESGEIDPLFQKEEWFSSTLLEWGPCGKLLVASKETLAFAQFAPAPLFPRLREFSAGRVSADAVYLAYCYVVPGRRARGLGSTLLRAVARDVVDRDVAAIEAIGDREWTGESWVLPEGFLTRCGFEPVREDPRFPLLRLDLRSRPVPQMAEERASAPVPLPALD
jgi:GNAT superfamily N-acetyltransferase